MQNRDFLLNRDLLFLEKEVKQGTQGIGVYAPLRNAAIFTVRYFGFLIPYYGELKEGERFIEEIGNDEFLRPFFGPFFSESLDKVKLYPIRLYYKGMRYLERIRFSSKRQEQLKLAYTYRREEFQKKESFFSDSFKP